MSNQSPLPPELDDLWERRGSLSVDDSNARDVVTAAVDRIDSGEVRVAFVDEGTDEVIVDDRAKRALLLAFRLLPLSSTRAGEFRYHDRIPMKGEIEGVRVVPGAIVRWGAYVAPGAVLMPSFVNIGGYVGSGTLVDTWATVGSCAQVGRDVHLSGGVGLGGVLEPVQAAPVIIEDDAFIGSRSMIVEGARVRRGAKLGAGTMLTASTPVIDAETGEEISRGEVPARAVAVSSSRVRKFAGGEFALPCVLVLRRLDENEVHDKLVLNDVLRDHGVAG